MKPVLRDHFDDSPTSDEKPLHIFVPPMKDHLSYKPLSVVFAVWSRITGFTVLHSTKSY